MNACCCQIIRVGPRPRNVLNVRCSGTLRKFMIRITSGSVSNRLRVGGIEENSAARSAGIRVSNSSRGNCAMSTSFRGVCGIRNAGTAVRMRGGMRGPSNDPCTVLGNFRFRLCRISSSNRGPIDLTRRCPFRRAAAANAAEEAVPCGASKAFCCTVGRIGNKGTN